MTYRAALISALAALFFGAAETSADITVTSISVPQEIEPGERFDVTYTLSGSSIIAVAELRFYIGNSPTGLIAGPLQESFQLPLIGSFPSYGPPAGPQTRSIRMPTSLQAFGCFPSGTWYFILIVDSRSRNSDSFAIAPMSISSFTPQTGPPCTPVTLSGNKFVDAANVLFNGTPAGGTLLSDTTIETSVPAGASTGPIQVTNSCASNPDAVSPSPFFVTAIVNPTTIDSFTPATASVGAWVRILGQNFTANTGVAFNGVAAARAVLDSQTIDALVPDGATDGPIAVGSACEGVDISTTHFIVDPYCASYATFLDASRVDSVRFGNLEYVNSEVPGCVVYSNNTELTAHVFPGQTGLPIQIRQGSCDANNYAKVTKLFADWNADDDFADAGEQVLAGPVAGSGLLVGSFDVPPAASLGTTRMRIVTSETIDPNDVAACGVYAGGETQDYTLEVSACAGTRDLPPTLWHLVALPCDPGASNSVQDVFADDLTGVYGTDWGVFEYDAATGQSSLMGLGDAVETGRGYWIKTLDGGQSLGAAGFNPQAIGAHGQPNPVRDTALVADPVAGRQNLVGFPFTFDVDWADVQVVDGGNVLTLDQADPMVGPDLACDLDPPDPSCVMSRVFYRWNGAAYISANGLTPGAQGVLNPLDGLWVKAFKSGISLRIPATPSSGLAPPAKRGQDGWFIRLSAASQDLLDDGNVLGELSDSVEGHDLHDLEELPPFGDPYLTVVFPHPDWQERAGDYTTDFRAPNPDPQAEPNRWRFEVRSSDPAAAVTLSWQGPHTRLIGSELIDEETGERLAIRPGASYSFTMTGPSRGFQWTVPGASLPPSDLIFADGFESGDTGAWQAFGLTKWKFIPAAGAPAKELER